MTTKPARWRIMQKRSSGKRAGILLALLALVCIGSLQTPAQTLRSVHSFTGAEGRELPGGVVQGPDGAFYGVNDYGDLLRLSSIGVLSIRPGASSVYAGPSVRLVQTSDGAFWGTSDLCSQACGQIIRFNANGTYDVVYTFHGGLDGDTPAGLSLSSNGDLYGTTVNGGNGLDATGKPGGAGQGTVFRISQSGSYTQLHAFTASTEGGYPKQGLIQASDGSFYGTTSIGGAGGKGSVFRIGITGQFAVLHSFSGDDGDTPQSVLWEANPGLLIGSTINGGVSNRACPQGCGTLYSISTNGQFETVYRFTNDVYGAGPNDNLFQASDGRIYGSSSGAGRNRGIDCSAPTNQAACWGSIFSFTSSGDLTNAFVATGPVGFNQPSGLLQGSAGDFWRTTYTDGDPAFGPTLSGGTVDTFTPAPPLAQGPVQLSFNRKIVRPNTAAVLHWQAVNAASLTMQQCFATIQAPSTGGGAWTGMQTGASAGNVYSGTASIVPTVAGTYTYTLTCGGTETGFASLNVGVPPPLVIQTASLLNGTLGMPYGPVGLQATGGDGEFHWSVLSGSLPSGLTLTDAGTLQGVPSLSGTYDFTIQVADGEDPAIFASKALHITVAAGLPTLSVLASPTHILPGGSVTVNAALTGVANGPLPGGKVTFTANGSSLSQSVALSANGQAIVSGSFFPTSGTYTIAASYGGDQNYQPVAATTQLLVAESSVTSLSSSMNPSVYGQGVTFLAAVSQPGISGSPDGSVTFSDGSNVLGTAQLMRGQASLTASALAVGPHTITASYSGGANSTPSISSALLQKVTPVGVTLGLTASPNPARQGDNVTLTLSLAATGKVLPVGGVASFFDGTTLLGTVVADGASVGLAVKGLTLGSHTITATYSTSGNGVGLNVASVNVNVLQSDFSLSGSGTKLDIPRTGYARVALTISPLGLYDQRVHLSCSSLPANAQCDFSEDWTAPLSQGSQKVTLLVNADLLEGYGPSGSVSKAEQWRFGGGVLTAAFLWLGRRRRRLVVLLALILSIGVSVQGCGGKEPAFTPPGDYAITVVAQDAEGRLHTIPMTMHVR